MAPSRSVELVGRVLGDRYRLMRPLGVGASAHVYAADDVVLRRRVAVKVLHPGLAEDAAFARRFRAEARAAAGLRHPHIVGVYDSGEDDGTPFLVMELLEGGSLRGLLDRGQLLTPSQAASVGAEVAGALAYAHRSGVVHRDIKPANLLFDGEGRPAVADFGLARALAEAAWTEPVGAVVGTLRYSAPEQLRGETVEGKADVYALALVLAEAVTGSVPFASEDPMATRYARLDRPIAPDPGLGRLGEVIALAGTLDPSERIDAAGLAAALKEAGAGLPPPGLLPLARPSGAEVVERDDSPTEIPGARAPFDIEAVEGPGGGAARTAQPAPPAGPRPAAHPAPRADDTVAGTPADSPADAGDAASAGVLAPRRGRRRRWLAAALAVLVLAGGAAGAVIATRPPPSHPVPVVVGKDLAQARSLLRPVHLRLGVTSRSYDARVPAGDIVSQQPASGRVREGSTLDVTVSLGPQPIPVPTGLAGKTKDEAAAVLQTLGLSVGAVTTQSSTTVPEGSVISSSPSSGTLLPGQPVALVVSSGKPFVTVPSLSGSTAASYSAASAALQSAGLAATATSEFSDTVPKGAVIRTEPGSGASVREGSTVAVVVSKGPDVVTVPDVSNKSVSDAAAALSGAGLSVSGVTGNPTATVTSTVPAAGSVVHRGSSVTIVTH